MHNEMIFGHIVEITVLFGATRFLADRMEHESNKNKNKRKIKNKNKNQPLNYKMTFSKSLFESVELSFLDF